MRSAGWVHGLVMAVLAALLLVLQSCGGGGGGGGGGSGGGTAPPQPPIASIEVASPSSTCITPPDSRTITAIARDANGNVIAGVTFTWSSSTTTVAAVDGNGIATAVAVGSTQITASAGGVQSPPLTVVVCAIAAGPPSGSTVLSGDVEGAVERETPLAAQTSTNYHFTFVDPFTRSVMFHNTFHANAKNGDAVTVRAFYKVEGQTTWIEEDWTGYEWIGFCRDFKAQRLSDLVVVTNGGFPAVVAAQPPRLMRNVVGCWAFTGSAKRVTRLGSWSSGTIELTASPAFDTNPGNHPNQYSDAVTGRLRVPIATPLFRTVDWRLVEAYTDSGCSYSLDVSQVETANASGGKGFASIVINNFLDSLPSAVRQQTIALHGATSLTYTADGGSTLAPLTGAVTGPQPDCGTNYDTAPALWLLTRDNATAAPVIDRLDGTLAGTFVDSSGGDTHTYTWTLTPQREP